MSDEWWKLSDEWPFFLTKQALIVSTCMLKISFLDMEHSALKAMPLLVELLWTHQANQGNHRKEWQPKNIKKQH